MNLPNDGRHTAALLKSSFPYRSRLMPDENGQWAASTCEVDMSLARLSRLVRPPATPRRYPAASRVIDIGSEQDASVAESMMSGGLPIRTATSYLTRLQRRDNEPVQWLLLSYADILN